MKKKSFFMFLCTMLLALGLIGNANALSIGNGGFETGDLTGWTAWVQGPGDGSVNVVTEQTSTVGGKLYTPTEGNYFASIQATAEIIQTELSWKAGDVLSFSWAFLAEDYYLFNDYSLFSIEDDQGNTIHDVTLATVSAVGDYGETGWQDYSYTFFTDGLGQISFGSWNVGNDLGDSFLLVDNIQPQPVPEPATMFLLGSGLIGLSIFGRKKFFKKS